MTYRREPGYDRPPPTNRNSNIPKFSIPNSAMGDTPYPPTINRPAKGKGKQTNEEAFLLKLIENMRAGFQEQINEIRSEIRGRESNQTRVPQSSQKQQR